MSRLTCLLLFLVFSGVAFSQTTTVDTLNSANVKDNFIVTIRKPAGYNSSGQYHHIYIVDGSIGMGDYILGKSDSWKATIPSSCVIIAISHTGNWHVQRNRDFIPTDLSKNSSKDFGNADKFYRFLKYELIPWVERKMPNKKDRSFIGHSLGGLICLYTALQGDKLFDYHFAISPSIWANHYEIDDIEEAHYKNKKQLKGKIYLYVGGLEFLNKVLYATRNFYTRVSGRGYPGLVISKREFADANHFSVRKPAVDEILKKFQD
jgi:predicted alpha/beta superfamily hydrolase